MERKSYLKPERLSTTLDDPLSAQKWTHWIKTFENFTNSLPEDVDKLHVLHNFVSATIFEYIADANTYDNAIATLESVFVKPKNEIFSRHNLFSRKQKQDETIKVYVNSLNVIAQDCNFRNVTAREYRQEYIRDAFINGLSSSNIRQRLLEQPNLTLEQSVNMATTLESAQKNAEEFLVTTPTIAATSDKIAQFSKTISKPISENTVSSTSKSTFNTERQKRFSTCFFCGKVPHNRSICPARLATCNNCFKVGHFSSVCHSKPVNKTISSAVIGVAAVENLTTCTIPIHLGSHTISGLIDTGSAVSLLDKSLVFRLNLSISHTDVSLSMADKTKLVKPCGSCLLDVEILGQRYTNMPFLVMDNLCSDMILGRDFMRQHECLNIKFYGERKPISVSALECMNITAPSPFKNLSENIRPVATPTRKHNRVDSEFISAEIDRLLEEGIIEPSMTPWRAQVLVVDGKKKRMVIDYSQTINKFTEQDAYPIPLIDTLVMKIAENNFYSTLDLKSAYHQISLDPNDRKYTGFQANGKLYQFTRLAFGLTNAVASFQRVINDIISKNNLDRTYAYLDDVIVCGRTKAEHDINLEKFMNVCKEYKLTLNTEKSKLNQEKISYLGYSIENNTLSPDPERLSALMNMPIPSNAKALQRLLGLFSYHSKWVPQYSEKIQPLLTVSNFPLSSECINCIDRIKLEIKKSSLVSFDENLPITVETDASDHTLSAMLIQRGKPIAYYSRTLKQSEKHMPSIEKEAYAIVESIHHWRHFLQYKNFTLLTDQEAVSYIFKRDGKGKTRNDKLLRWRLELSTYTYDVKYRPGKDNIGADALSRACATTNTSIGLIELHKLLCHPGVSRLYHYVKTRNLPYSVEDVRRICSSCKICCELKPRFFRPPTGKVIKASKPFERISLDFKGPLLSNSRNSYLLVLIDEYSRFPFLFACPDVSSASVISCLQSLFALCGIPNSIHSDRGQSFMSNELRTYLSNLGIAQSRSTPYHPKGNGQCERYVGIAWKTIQLALKESNLSINSWEKVIPSALHALRTLLCTATNETPHERFFVFPRKNSFSSQLPSWLSSPGPVYLRRFVRDNKRAPLVDKVELIHANNNYALIRYPSGREDTVSTRDLAPVGNHDELEMFIHKTDEETNNTDEETNDFIINDQERNTTVENHEIANEVVDLLDQPETVNQEENNKGEQDLESQVVLRRSTRERHPPNRFIFDDN